MLESVSACNVGGKTDGSPVMVFVRREGNTTTNVNLREGSSFLSFLRITWLFTVYWIKLTIGLSKRGVRTYPHSQIMSYKDDISETL